MGIEGKLLVSRKNIVVSKDSIGIDKDLKKDRNLNTFKMYCNGERAAPGSRTEKQEIVCMRVIAWLAMTRRALVKQTRKKRNLANEGGSFEPSNLCELRACKVQRYSAGPQDEQESPLLRSVRRPHGPVSAATGRKCAQWHWKAV